MCKPCSPVAKIIVKTKPLVESVTMSVSPVNVSAVSDYDQLTNKPSINNVELMGDQSLSELGIQPEGNYATVSQLNGKVDKIEGKQLSSNNFTDDDKLKLDTIQEGAEVNVNADWDSTSGDSEILNKPTHLPNPSTLTFTGAVVATYDGSNDVTVDIPAGGGGGSGTTDYVELVNKPSINNIELVGNKTLTELGIQPKGDYATVSDLDGKVDKVSGKQLSTNDFTNADKLKLDGIQNGAEVNVNADWNSISGDSQILNKPTSLPNPNALTFTGAVQATYDGSGAVSVDIPTSGGSGTSDYEELENKPSINNVELIGNKTLAQLGIQPSGDYPTNSEMVSAIAIETSNRISADENIMIELNGKADTSEIPIKTSQLVNDSGFLTQIPPEYTTESEVDSKIQMAITGVLGGSY